jgi:hypothetical protein
MIALEDGRFWHDSLKRAGRPADRGVDMNRLREFAEVARFFRIEGECRLPGASHPNDPGATPSGRATAAGRIYRAILAEAARQYARMPRDRGEPPDAGLVFDARLADRLGSWSIRWGRAQAGAGEDRAAQFKAIRSHIERMASLEDGRSLNEALARAGRDAVASAAPAPPRAFADVARFFRLEALWEMERIKSHGG